MKQNQSKIKKRGRKPRAPSKAEFEFQYYTCDLPAEEMAKLYKVTRNTIYNWATEFRKEKKGEK